MSLLGGIPHPPKKEEFSGYHQKELGSNAY